MIDDRELSNVIESVKSGWISSKGSFISEFENKFSSYMGKKFSIATSNGTTALHLAVSALGIRPGDEVIVPDFTFVSPVNAVLYEHAKPVLVDVEKNLWGIDPDLIEKKITKKTKAIIAVHIYGNSAKIDEIRDIAEDHNLFLIEDCAESIGAKYNGKKVGTRGIISCFSFYGNKIITTGEGGMCLTEDDNINNRIRILRDHGMSQNRRYWHEIVGYNYRMTNLQAAIGVAQLSKIHTIIAKKKQIAKRYTEMLPSQIDVQSNDEMSDGVFWLFSILANNIKDKNRMVKVLNNAGVETRNFFYPVHIMPPYRELNFNPKEMKISSKISNHGINLPSYPEITDSDINYISSLISNCIK